MDDQENGKREAVGQPAQDLDERRWPPVETPSRRRAAALSLERLAFRDGAASAVPRAAASIEAGPPGGRPMGQAGPVDA